MEESQKKLYQDMVEQLKPKNTALKNTFRAFWVGGTICLMAELLKFVFLKYGIEDELSGNLVTITFIFLGVFLTGVGVYEKLGKYAGAGSIVPISGFANSVASPAIEYKKEGLISGVGAKIFTVAGPVILYGVFTSVALGLIYYFMYKI